ncbi:MAG: TrmH family RNA methyltransferase [archaeon]
MQKKLVLLFDSLRDPRDLAQMIHLGLAAGIEIELTGSSLPPTHQKVINIIDSWIHNFRDNQELSHVSIHSDFEKRIKALKKQGYGIMGTSSQKGSNLFQADLSKGKHVIVFGTETSGLSKEKMDLMDKILRVPMQNNTKFFTISAIAPVFAYEALKQKKLV